MLPAVLVPRDGHSPAREAGLAQGRPQGGDPLSLPGDGRAEGGGTWVGPGIWGSPCAPPSHPTTQPVPFTQLSIGTFMAIHTCAPGHGQGGP